MVVVHLIRTERPHHIEKENGMRGTIHNQVEGLFQCTAKSIGVSRHKAKQDIGSTHSIHSDNTRATYRWVWHSLADYAATQHGLTQVEQISPQIAQEWLSNALRRNVAPATMATYLSAVRKFLNVLEVFSKRSQCS